MYYGKTTKKLEQLYAEYKKFGDATRTVKKN